MKSPKIPKAMREQLWLRHFGHKFETKCSTSWCSNKITAFDFHCGHDQPRSKGGATDLTNLVPICARCNISMGNSYTFKEWNVAAKGVSRCCSSSVAVEPGLAPVVNK